MAPGEPDGPKNSLIQPDNSYLIYLGTTMHLLRQRNKLIDVLITCGKRSFPAHRLVLCSASSFFQNLLLNQNPQNEINTIDMEDVSEDVVEILLDYMYKGSMNPRSLSNQDTIIKLLTASELLQINGSVLYVTTQALQICPRNIAIALWDWSEDFENQVVEKAVVNYLACNLGEVGEVRDFCKICMKRLTTLLQQQVVTRMNPQDPVVEALLCWIKFDLDHRILLLCSLTETIQLNKLTDQYVQHLLQEDPVVAENTEFKSRLMEIRMSPSSPSSQQEKMVRSKSSPERFGVNCHMLPNTPREITCKLSDNESDVKSTGFNSWKLTSNRTVRNSNSIYTLGEAVKSFSGAVLLLLGKDDANRPVVHLYIPEKNLWTMSYEVKCPCLDKMACSYYKGRLYLMGGEDERQRKQSTTYVFHLGTQTVREGPPLRLPRSNPGVVQFDELVYVVDGINRYGSYMTHVECFNMEDELWKIIPPTKETHQHPGVEVIDGKLYVIGGFTMRCECFNPSWDTWQDIISLPEMFKDCTVMTACHDNKIFAFRYFKPDRVCCLDPTKNEWRVMRTMGYPPDRIMILCNVNGELWALDKQGHFFIFDIETNTWEQSFSTPKNLTTRIYVTVAHLDNSCL